MSESDKPKPPVFDVSSLPPIPSVEDVQAKAQEKLQQAPPEVREAVAKTQSFYQRNKDVILVGVGVIAVMKINKRMVKKATVKAVAKAMKSSDGAIQTYADASGNFPSMFDILNDLRETPGMAYIPHGGGMVHLLKGKDAIVTVFGDFDKMSTEDLWNRVANILNLNVRT